MPLEIIPSIDLRGGCVVRLKQGDYGRQISYDVDPIDVAKRYADAGATRMHVVDLDGAKQGRPVQTENIRRILDSTKLKIQVGGGIRSTDDLRQLLDLGVDRVVIGTHALQHWEWFRSTVHEPELNRRLILAIDARDGVIATHGWTEVSGRSVFDVAAEVTDWPLAGLLYTDVAKDGMLGGPNVSATATLAAATNVPVIASGGVGSVEDIRRLNDGRIAAVIVGRSLYEGKVDLREAIAAGEGSEGVRG